MELEFDEVRGIVQVRLSKRNLLALLHKVDEDESARRLIKESSCGQYQLVVIAEPDEEHYGHDETSAEPGPCCAATERFISENALRAFPSEARPHNNDHEADGA